MPKRKSPAQKVAPTEIITCTPKGLPSNLIVPAAKKAVEINPVNHPRLDRLSMVMPGFAPTPERIAVVTTKYWHGGGVKLKVGFLDNPPSDLKKRILLHMNAWAKSCNVQFVESKSDPQVRIARTPGGGHWSFVGTDILSIAANKPTMNLDSFSMQTPESEYHRVVRHETGHTLGCPHEHMRKELVKQIDVKKAIQYYQQTQGWDEQTVRLQVLTPIEESSLIGTVHTDANSIMCYQIPGIITKTGEAIQGGLDIDKTDYDFMATIYPKPKSSASALKDPVLKSKSKKKSKKSAKPSKARNGGKKS